MRYAAKPAMPLVDGYLLFAPHLGEKSPTSNTPVPAGSAEPDVSLEAPLKVQVPRTIGLIMLNSIGISAFNHVGTLYFNVSDGNGRMYYSFAAMADMAPEDYRVALSADEKPLLLIAFTCG